MKGWIVALAALLVPAPALAQQTSDDSVTITGEDRSDTYQKQVEAQRTAVEARKLFAEMRGSSDVSIACRKASEADREYALAISAASAQAKDAKSPLKERTEERVKLMKDQRKDLDNLHDRLCRSGDLAQPKPGLRNRTLDRRP